MKKHVEQEDEIGIEIVNMQMKFIKALSTGEFSKVLGQNLKKGISFFI